MKNLTKKLVMIALGLMLLNPLFVVVQTASAATSPATTTTPPSQPPPTLPVYNAGVDQSLKDYLCTPSDPADGHDLERCINRLYRFGVTAGALVLVFMIVFAGYMYITGGETAKGKAKTYVLSAFTGLGILLGSYVLLYFINPTLVVFKPIQPPIFTADNLPSCEAIGFNSNCIITTGANAGQMVGGGTCAMPLDVTKVSHFNSSVHNPWDNNPETPDKHRPVHRPPNGPPPEGAVDLYNVRTPIPVYAPIAGRVFTNNELPPKGVVGRYISITSDTRPGAGCENANACASLAHIDPSVNVGDMVQTGQQVGVTHMWTEGSGPHLHFELKINGQWITGDGKAGTWNNMKAAISSCSKTNGGSAPAGLVNANSVVPSLVVDMQYASAIPDNYNFTKTALYVGQYSQYASACFLTQSMADDLKKANDALQIKKPGWKIKAWDCYRPFPIQQQMYNLVKNDPALKGLVATPDPNAQHPRGLAIDATLVDASGNDVPMPTHFDYFNTVNGMQNPNSTAYKKAANIVNSDLLNTIMTSPGMHRASTEWWHFGLSN